MSMLSEIQMEHDLVWSSLIWFKFYFKPQLQSIHLDTVNY